MNLELKIDEDFYSDPQLSLFFQDEKAKKIPSKLMWALVLYSHPKSLYATLDPSSRVLLIEQDYLKSKLDVSKYQDILDKIGKISLTKSKRLLDSWEKKLEERDEFIRTLSYSQETYEILDKMMAATSKMWDNYQQVKKKAEEESDSRVLGDTELSLSDKGII